MGKTVRTEHKLNDEQNSSVTSKDSAVARSRVQKVATSISEGLERLFFNVGFAVASRPWTVVLCTFFVSSLFGLGMIRFELKDSSEPIWIPKDSEVLIHQQWVEEMFPVKSRYNMILITADNVLDPSVIKQMYEIDKMVKGLSEVNNSKSDLYNFNWTSICIRISENCWSSSILELWQFDGDVIEQLTDVEQVAEKIESTSNSPVYNFEFVPSNWLGGLTYDGNGRIIGARAAKMLYVLKATSTNEFNTKVIGPDLLWEERFIELGVKLNQEMQGPIQSIDVSAVRSFRDESDNSFEGDVTLLLVGVGIIVAYVAIILGKFNEVEHKVYLALVGVFGIGLASLVSYGFASAIGMFYGPIHPILPFLLLGLGVDDMFVIIEAWNNLTPLQKKNDLKLKVAIAMQHAGVSITVTSITDFVAFAIGGSTSLPALKSFCVYASLGILSLFIIQSTFFVAWLTIDQRRQDASRDACCIWIKYISFQPNRCSRRQFLPWFLRKFIAPFLISLPIKVLVLSLVVGMFAISGYGTYLLRTDSDLSWFLPTDSYFTRFLSAQDKYFENGIAANLYIGDIDYFNSRYELGNMTSTLEDSQIVRGNITNWHSAFYRWLETDEAANVASYFGVELDKVGSPVSEEGFYKLLNGFVSTSGKQFYESLKWNDTNAHNYRILEASKMSLVVQDFPGSERDTESLLFFEETTKQFFADQAFVWSINFRNYETNRIIQKELYTNIGLAFMAVFIVTLLLVANLSTCILVCTCVLITLVNVCGFMHFWGLTIDTLTSILLILSIGLAIDYSAHIGHTFMTIHGSRNERARRSITTIGPAVINGGFTTFLAIILLATSNSYVFITFFKVFFLVVIFGLFNGICVLPVLLSCFGPQPYLNARSGVTLASLQPAVTGQGPIQSATLEADNLQQKQTHKPHSSYAKSDVRSPPDRNQAPAKYDASLRLLAEDIEMNVVKETPVVEQPLTCEELILDCETYLQREQASNIERT